MQLETVEVPVDILKACLYRLESDWWQMDSEWGLCDEGLDVAVKNGHCPEIAELRRILGL